MTRTVTALTDRVLAKVAPRVEAGASCQYDTFLYCYCDGIDQYGQWCMIGCPGVPNHCTTCTWIYWCD